MNDREKIIYLKFLLECYTLDYLETVEIDVIEELLDVVKNVEVLGIRANKSPYFGTEKWEMVE